MIAKAVFTIIDDVDGEKTTIIKEYGPFNVDDGHIVDSLIVFLNRDKDEEAAEAELSKIIT